MVSIPLEWTISIKGGNEVKTTVNQLSDAFKRGEISREEFNKAMARGNRTALQALNTDRYQMNILKAQYPALQRVSRAMSTVTSISRSLLTISNALNISKISGNLQDSAQITTQNELNALLRRRDELMKQNLVGSKEWIENEEAIRVKTQELKEKNQELIDQKWDGLLTSIESVFFGIGTIFTNLINNPTIFKALVKAGSFFGGVFSGFFTLSSNAVIKAGTWITGLISPKITSKIYTSGLFSGNVFGAAFAVGVGTAIAVAAVGIIDIINEKLGGGSILKKMGLSSASDVIKGGTGVDVKGFETGSSDDPAVKRLHPPEETVSLWQPIIDLFTITIPQALTTAKDGFFNMFKATTDLTNQFGANLVSGVNNIFGELIASMNKAISSYNKAAKKMKKPTIGHLTFTPSVFTPIPAIAAAKGFDGMVNSPTMFLAGEAGAEHVNITPNGQSSGGNTIIINVAGSIMTEKKLAYMVDQYQKQNLKSRGFTGFG